MPATHTDEKEKKKKVTPRVASWVTRTQKTSHPPSHDLGSARCSAVFPLVMLCSLSLSLTLPLGLGFEMHCTAGQEGDARQHAHTDGRRRSVEGFQNDTAKYKESEKPAMRKND